MASVKAANISISEARWLDKSQAMAWVGIQTESIFDQKWGLYLNLYDNGGKGGRFDKRQIDVLMEKRMEKRGLPFNE